MFRRWNPFEELDALRREVDRVFEGFMTPGRMRRPFYAAFLPGTAARNYPLLNVSESPEEYTVEALAPGLDLDTLDVSCKGSTLTISGEKKKLEDVSPEAYHRNERSTGRFTRTLELDSEIDVDKVSARYTNGMLIITLPKSEEAKPKQIEVTVA